jgi:NADP-dependent 3-hydroxy acid dehydrogenase YdfG
MSDRVAVITGASSGIGEATARALSSEGYNVVLAARREDRINQLRDELNSNGSKALAVPTDVSDEASANALIKAAQDEYGRVDALINNAGVMLLGAVQGAETDEWRTMVNVNVLGLMYCTHAAIPVMQAGGGGHIVNVSSVAGRIAAMGSAAYNATKWAVVGFSEALRQEVLFSNIRVTIVEPGFVETELQGHNTNPVVVEAIQKYAEETKPLLTADDIAASITYALGQPEHVAVNEILIRPTKQRR